MSEAHWRLLGITRTATEADVRRAYAAKLRVTNPEDDAEGFKALRQAYEWALGYARYAVQYGIQYDDEDEDDLSGEEIEIIEDAEDAAHEGLPDNVVVEPYTPPNPALATSGAEPDRPADTPEEIDRRIHEQCCNRLVETLRSNAPLHDRQEALEAVLRSPALDQVDIYTRTEQWLSDLLAAARPASDELIGRVIDFFGWETQIQRHGGPSILIHLRERIKAEREADLLLTRIKNPRHEYHRAYKETLRPPEKRSWLNKFFSLRRTGRVIEFLNYAAAKAPSIYESLNWQAVDWWRGRVPTARRVGKILNVMVYSCFFLVVAFVVPVFSSKQTPNDSGGINSLALNSLADRANDSRRASLLDMLPEEERAPASRLSTRRACTDAVRKLRYMPSTGYSPVLGDAEENCAAFLELTPESLLIRQYAGIAALHARRASAALEHFDYILKASPDDAYALYGRGLVSLAGPEGARIGDPKDLSDAIAMNLDVKIYFAEYRLLAPDAKASPEKPASRLPKPSPAPRDTEAEQIDNPDAPDGPEVGSHFGLTRDLEGEASLYCFITADGKLRDCVIKSETTSNIGLGEVALYMSQFVRFKPATLNGEPVDGVPLQYTFQFNKPPPPAGAAADPPG